MRNRSLVVPVLSCFLLFAACGEPGDGNLVSETREVGDFVRVENAFNLRSVITIGPSAVSVMVDSNLMPLVTTEVRDGTLFLDATKSVQPSGGVVTVSLPDFRGAALTGSAEVSVTGVQTTQDIRLVNDGSGAFSFDGDVEALEVLSAGSGEMTLTGTADTMDVGSSGSGSVDAIGLEATSARLISSGSGSIGATLAGGTVQFDLSGSGSIDWFGTAVVTATNVTGSGSVTHH